MSLTPGTTLGPYEILAPIGAGGMGEVYQARDTKLGREVAIKVLPDDFSQDKERLARFEREARLLAALNHPNIAAIYDLEHEEGIQFLVLELVPGETLAETLAKVGRLPVEEALPIFKQIAEALEAAHEKGIIHRDLKPANIKITPAGKVKVLDFGLARVAEDTPTSDLSHSPTITRDGTRAGVIMGTAAYMSPEQARGKSVDKRTDVWGFGCVFYEVLTGKSAFLGETVSDTLAAILKQEPNWDRLPGETPPPIRSLLRRCLQKDPQKRQHDVADARIEIEEALAEPASTGVPAGKYAGLVSMPRMVLLALIAATAGALAVWGTMRPDPSPTQTLARAVMPLSHKVVLSQANNTLAISRNTSCLRRRARRHATTLSPSLGSARRRRHRRD